MCSERVTWYPEFCVVTSAQVHMIVSFSQDIHAA